MGRNRDQTTFRNSSLKRKGKQPSLKTNKVKFSRSFQKSFDANNPARRINPAFKSSQDTIDLLESISPTDIAMAQPYVRIVSLDPNTRQPIPGAKPLNVFFSQPPRFGNSIQQNNSFGDPVIMGERPPVSLERVSIKTKQNYGLIMEEWIDIELTVHRPNAVFGSDDSGWATLITPGREHLMEYGWTGSSKNGLINGFGIDDIKSRTYIKSKRSLVFVTSVYSFTIQPDGQIKLKIKAHNNGQLMLRNVTVGEIREIQEVINTDIGPSIHKKDVLSKSQRSQISERLQKKLQEIASNDGMVTLFDFANAFIANTVITMGPAFGYGDFVFQFADFNKTSGTAGKKDSLGGGIDYSSSGGRSIGDFLFTKKYIRDYLTKLSKSDMQMTLGNFVQGLLTTINSVVKWNYDNKGDESLKFKKPNIRVKVQDIVISGKRALHFVIYDEWAERQRLEVDGPLTLEKGEHTRKTIKERVTASGTPFVTLGKGFSYIQGGSFEAIQDDQVQRVKMEQAFAGSVGQGAAKRRREWLQESAEAFSRGGPNPFHEIFASAIKGNITMLGNFAFDTFGLLWLDFRSNVWSGPFVITEREDVLTRASFLTKIQVHSESADPLNTRRRLTEAQLIERKRLKAKSDELKSQKKKPRKKNRSSSNKKKSR